MIFNHYPVPAPFNEYIEAVFHFKDFIPDHSIERVVPTGHSFLIFELDDMPRNTFHNDTLKPKETYTRVWISGMHENHISISAHHRSEMFVVQFKAYGGMPFLHIPMSELNNRVVPAEDILGEGIFDFRNELLLGSDSQDKFKSAGRWLESRFDQKKVPATEMTAVAKDLIQKPGIPFKEVLERYPKTQKHLIEQFKRYCGLTPKILHRIFRFNDILAKVQKEEKISWSQIAYDCGYSDQSHFIKEFKAFSGFNPRQFIRQEFHKEEESNFFPLDREG
ncbi:helix-turn-helix domain-containing protein [Poritiphilus flavus]|uniref:Helix-turn-helix domain-containing protein n=1 Tax=Poritiphilus flavus TaxID=2697053 RepID=A0A6L9E8Q5_9FLAO|nr:helix-turn-helix domain-containing protein [Poritiphilus flavus]NAS11106.1 helix-turn-helix domain-containing protein [Poritiphilus flavus]